jgi:alpha-beta hydrolase superfamily lysophospholipase
MGKPIVPEWPGHGRTRGEAGYVDASAFRAVAERLLALQEADAPERQILDFLAALCRAHAEDVMDARAQGFMRRPFGP